MVVPWMKGLGLMTVVVVLLEITQNNKTHPPLGYLANNCM